jgi:hypothetical protein
MCALGNNPTASPVIIHFDEINILAKKTSQDGSNGISAFNTLFEDHDYDHPLARNGGYTVRNAYLALIGASTVDDFITTWKSQHKDAGFLNRLLTIGVDGPEKSIAIPVNPARDDVTGLIKRVADLRAEVQQHPKSYGFTREAQQLWAAFYASIGDSDEWNRIDTYGLRLMALQTLLAGEDEVSRATVERVIQFLKYEVIVRQCVAPIVADNAIAELEQAILQRLESSPNGMTKRQLSRATNAHRKGTELFNRAIKNLVDEGEIGSQEVGRSLICWRISPDGAEDVINSVIMHPDDTRKGPKLNTISYVGTDDRPCHHVISTPQPTTRVC